VNELWSQRGWLARVLTPIAFLYRVVVFVRVSLYKSGVLKSASSGIPVVVVGNISVGGTGKTPMVSTLVRKLQTAGFNPGIVSRGYGAVPAREPRLITADTQIEWAGDEPSLLSRETGVPVCICIARPAAVDFLVNEAQVDVVVSDDGLQHYAMQRDIEVAVVDGQRLLGNGWLLPAGPLREPSSRLNGVDIIAVQQPPGVTPENRIKTIGSLNLATDNPAASGSFHLDIVTLKNLHNNEQVALTEFAHKQVHAIAGVGNPQRFFDSLQNAGLIVMEHVMPDHHKYVVEDVQFEDELPVLMTAKDAVKVRELSIDLAGMYEVSVTVVLDEKLNMAIDAVVERIRST